MILPRRRGNGVPYVLLTRGISADCGLSLHHILWNLATANTWWLMKNAIAVPILYTGALETFKCSALASCQQANHKSLWELDFSSLQHNFTTPLTLMNVDMDKAMIDFKDIHELWASLFMC